MSIDRGMRFLGANTEPLEAGDVTARFDPGTAFTDDDGSQKGVPEDAEAVPLIGRDRQVNVSISSELPVLRDGPSGPFWEILNHNRESIDLGRVKSGAVPLLKDHKKDIGSQIGKVLSVSVTGGGAGRGDAGPMGGGVADQPFAGVLLSDGTKARAVVQFSSSPEGEAAFDAVLSGDISNVSVGYTVHSYRQLSELHDGLPVLVADKWEVLEVSLVAVPADPTVGFGRSLRRPARPVFMENQMNKQNNAPAGGELAERNRAAEIATLGRRFNVDQGVVADAIARGTSARDFGASVLNRMDEGTPTRSRMGAPSLAKEPVPYSLVRAIAAQVSGNWSEAGFEHEMAQEMHRQRGRAASGFFMPTAALVGSQGRALLTTANAAAVIGTDHMGDKFIDSLKPQVRVLELGATTLFGLIENASIPRMTVGTSAEWIAEDAAATESSPQFDSVDLTLKQLSANARLSRRQMKQSLPALDQMLTQDMRNQIAVALDRAAIAGTGTGTQPRGILSTPGIHTRAMGANGGAITWAALTALAALVKGANVAADSLGWLTNHKVEGAMHSTPRVTGTETMILSPDEADPVIARHPARFSGNVPGNLTKGSGTNLSALIFGNWSDLLIGQWGGVDVIVDDATEASKGNVRIAAHSEWDIAVRHAEAFGAITDIVTPT